MGRGRAGVAAVQWEWRTLKLRVIPPPSIGYVTSAPPAITVTPNANQYLCGECGTLLVVAADDEVHGLIVRCRACGRYNQVET
jgi:DNA-directed RNA polymerase subunit RPC12/RpoP